MYYVTFIVTMFYLILIIKTFFKLFYLLRNSVQISYKAFSTQAVCLLYGVFNILSLSVSIHYMKRDFMSGNAVQYTTAQYVDELSEVKIWI